MAFQPFKKGDGKVSKPSTPAKKLPLPKIPAKKSPFPFKKGGK